MAKHIFLMGVSLGSWSKKIYLNIRNAKITRIFLSVFLNVYRKLTKTNQNQKIRNKTILMCCNIKMSMLFIMSCWYLMLWCYYLSSGPMLFVHITTHSPHKSVLTNHFNMKTYLVFIFKFCLFLCRHYYQFIRLIKTVESLFSENYMVMLHSKTTK